MSWRKLGCLLGLCAALLTLEITLADSQPFSWHIVQGSDGTVYAVNGQFRVMIVPDPVSDDDLAALVDLGGTTAVLPQVQSQQAIAPIPTATPVPPQSAAPEQLVTLSGGGDVNTRPFTLRGGNYTSTWSTSGRAGCFFGANLKPVSQSSRFFGADAGNGQVKSGQTQVYSVPAGDYYIGVLSTCDKWTLTLSPLQ